MTSGEQRYLIQLVRRWAAGGGPVPLSAAVTADAVWSALCAHSVAGCLGPLLPASGRPRGADAEIAAARRRSELMLLECERILPGIRSSAGHCVLLKGAALALTAYPRAGDRWFIDLDILVPRGAVAAVCAHLETIGYRCLRTGRDPLFYDKYHLHRILLGPQGSVVEIHWDLTLPRSVYRHDPDGVFARARTALLGAEDVACASPVDQILHGVYQNIADGYVDLRRVLDFVLLGRQLNDEDWAELTRLAAEGGLEKALWLSLHIVKYIAGYAPPAADLTEIAPRGAVLRTLQGLEVAHGCLERRAVSRDGYVPLLHLLLTPTVRLQLAELARAVRVDEERILDQGYGPGAWPGPGIKLRLGLRQMRTMLRATALAGRGFVRG